MMCNILFLHFIYKHEKALDYIRMHVNHKRDQMFFFVLAIKQPPKFYKIKKLYKAIS